MVSSSRVTTLLVLLASSVQCRKQKAATANCQANYQATHRNAIDVHHHIIPDFYAQAVVANGGENTHSLSEMNDVCGAGRVPCA